MDLLCDCWLMRVIFKQEKTVDVHKKLYRTRQTAVGGGTVIPASVCNNRSKKASA